MTDSKPSPSHIVDESEQPGAGPSTAINLPSSDEAAPSYSSHFKGPEQFVPQGGEEPPPAFTPYEAEYFVSGAHGAIVSHDSHLNEDGEALYRFLLSHAESFPGVHVRIYGSHKETVSHLVARQDSCGQRHMVREHDTEEVTGMYASCLVSLATNAVLRSDFDFMIDVGQHIASGPIHWSVPDEEPAYRGKMYKEVDIYASNQNADEEEALFTTLRRKATKEEIKMARSHREERMAKGLPPWAAIDESQAGHGADALAIQANVLKSSKTLRQWADEYCASNKLLKEFTYRKVIYGWNLANLEAAISAAVKSTYYTGNFEVHFELTNAKIHIRPDNWLSRTLSNKWLKFLLFLFLIYPFIWLYQRFGRRGGGRWEVCGGAYALKTWQLVDASTRESSTKSSPPPPFSTLDAGILDDRTMQTPSGMAKLVGLREGEWFQQWEGTIRRAVTGRLRSRISLREPDDGRATEPAIVLDGYNGNLLIQGTEPGNSAL
ncbi:uncharacterized protein LAESUDRAFT_661390 [Laetiporus sulphureus 93-53]|uniref:Uncharacterized protein n=1 Tax=Laetiporus sulphureus 93-53 TaxID=1314785 RepID=A0A165CEJ1_9APHY|nr:uncharacterized protein LAESUDRAFT_661390 [Laetiporus sulphureus 93-53]KZT02671.1 hypothetical protein LAESUDRAFT_661390 [Laetiporus sulphureus 93-53]